jgi:hypothetical protein
LFCYLVKLRTILFSGLATTAWCTDMDVQRPCYQPALVIDVDFSSLRLMFWTSMSETTIVAVRTFAKG